MRVRIPFTGQHEKGESTFSDAQRCVNWYPRRKNNRIELYGTPGLESWVDLGTNKPIRALLPSDNDEFLFAVSGNKFFRISQGGTAAEIGAGTIITSDGLVGIATNGLDVTFVDGPNGYVYDVALATLTKITDADFPGGTHIIFIDGFYFVNDPDSNQFHQSTINDGSSWPGNFDSAGSTPSNIVAMIADHEDAWVFKERAAEIWYRPSGTLTGFILTTNRGAFIEQGIVAAQSVAIGNNAVYWLGKDKEGHGQVFQATAKNPRVVSTPEIEFQIDSYSDISDAEGLTYQQLGHSFYVLSFPTGGKTWVYDSTMEFWHERSSRFTAPSGQKTDGRWRINTHALFNGNHIVGDFDNGKLYKLKNDVYDEDGEVLIATRVSQMLRNNQNDITVNGVQILFEPGVGLVSGQGSDPVSAFRWSIDGGNTWGNAIDLPLGKIGEYLNRAITTPLGQGRNWAFETSISDPIKRVLVDAFADIEQDID